MNIALLRIGKDKEIQRKQISREGESVITIESEKHTYKKKVDGIVQWERGQVSVCV